MNTSDIINILQSVAFPSMDANFFDAQYYLANHLNINTYVRCVKGPHGENVWRPHIEPFTSPVGIEFNYIYKDWERAMWAALVAACVYRLNRNEPIGDICDHILDCWKECDLKPDFKTKPRPKKESKTDAQKTREVMEELLGRTSGNFSFGDKSNPFGSIFGT